MSRREFTRNQREEIVERSKRDGVICCEGCRQVLGGKPHEIDHVIPEALRPEADKKAKITVAEGQLLGMCCHRGPDGKTNKDVKAIAKGKRQYNRANGLHQPAGNLKSAGFPKPDKEAQRAARRAASKPSRAAPAYPSRRRKTQPPVSTGDSKSGAKLGNDCVCQHVGYCDGSCQHPEPLAARLSAAYEKVAAWPENRMTPDAVEELGEGFTDLLKLRNLVPDVLAYLSSTSAGVTEEQTPRVKQLEWVEYWSGSDEDIPCWRGGNPLGFYADVCFAGKYKLAKHSEAPSSELADRKAAEQTRYEKAIIAALEASRSPVSQNEADTVTISVERFKAITAQAGRYEAYERLSQKEAVPVAWRYRANVSQDWSLVASPWPEDWPDHYERRPLYASPVPAPAGEPEIKALETALLKALEAMVLSIAFYGRDKGTNRYETTMEQLCAKWVETDAAIRSALHPTPMPVSAPVGVVEKTEHLLQTVGDGIVAMFEQMIKGNWRDDHDHDVKMNVAMMNLQTVVQEVMEFRTEHLGYCAPRARTEVENG
ncbi:hypothetical protein J1C56_01780 [Aminobacter anthyllidis]|uniref:Uncharacterized protein n=1 Tax=Aminobacter anthyllidis TaxID=1035067 RepID=A0A9X1A6T8_9HYPH|nr:hypothetical protein [Aminobacter anthyllidis]MBT1154314.1 hypothetical protein [Aminobacter anthyllidis]